MNPFWYLVRADFTACEPDFPFHGVRWFGLDGIHAHGGLRPFETAMEAHCFAVGFDAALALKNPDAIRPAVSLEQAIAAPADIQRQIPCDDDGGVGHE